MFCILHGRVFVMETDNLPLLGVSRNIVATTINEPPRGKTSNVVFEQVRHKSGCTVTEDDLRLEISDLERRGIVLCV